MLIFLLAFSFLFMLYIVYKKFDHDVISPSFILVFGYTFSVFFALPNIDQWGIDLSWKTIGVLWYGTSLFIITSYYVKKFFENIFNYQSLTCNEEIIIYSQNRVLIYSCCQMLLMIIWCIGIYYFTSTMGEYKDFASRMVAFKTYSSYSMDWLNSRVFFVMNQLVQIGSLSLMLFSYIFIHNIVLGERWVKNKFLLLSILISLLQILLTGGRGGVLDWILYSTVVLLFFRKKYFDIDLKFSLSLVLKGVGILFIGIIGFFYTKVLVGRGSTDLELRNIMPYITMYVGGPVQLLDMFLKNPIPSSEIWGKETFYSIILQFIRLGFCDIEPYIMHLEFRTASTGVFLGNIYTAYRSYIYDFGYVGLTVLPIIFSAFSSFLYYYIKANNAIRGFSIIVCIYLLLIFSLFFDYSRCFFFSSFVSFSIIKKIIILYILACLFIVNFQSKYCRIFKKII